MRYKEYLVCSNVSDYVYTEYNNRMCLVLLFVVSKTLDSSELLCLLEMGVEYYLVCIKYYVSTTINMFSFKLLVVNYYLIPLKIQ